MAKSDATPVFFIAFIALLALLPNAWQYLDKAGWIPHYEVIGAYIGQNGWMPGEYRDCIALPTSDGKLTRASGGILACDLEGHATEDLTTVVPHQLDVTFWGRVERREMGGVNDEELRRRDAICAEPPKNEQERTTRRDLCDEKKHIGKIEWRWRCRRNTESITCWAAN